jgi:hypothetical protein
MPTVSKISPFLIRIYVHSRTFVKKNDELKRTRSGSKLNHVLKGGNIGTGGSLKTWIQQFNSVKMSSEKNFF